MAEPAFENEMPDQSDAGDGALGADACQVLVTAEEAYPAFERAVLSAKREVLGGFRIFDLSTRLRSPEAREIGEDWFDLLLHKVGQGVRIHLLISDFEPVYGTELHGGTWMTVRAGVALRELAPDPSLVDIRASLHPAGVGLVPRLLLMPRVTGALRHHLRRIRGMGKGERESFLRKHPHLSSLFLRSTNQLRPRRWPLPPLWPVTHHQKAAAIDGEWLYIGGLDLDERRWDTKRHERPADETWQDVQLLLRDRAGAEALATHLATLPAVIRGALPPPDLGGHILRTLSASRKREVLTLSPKPLRAEIKGAILEGIAGAREFIYLETQFLRDRSLAKALARQAEKEPGLTLIAVIPGAPEDVAFEGATREDARYGEWLQWRCVRRLRRAYRGRVFIGSPARRVTAQGRGRSVLFGAPIIYVHSKVSIFDDELAIVGSANLNGRSLYWDTELAVALHGPARVRPVRERLMCHMLGSAADEEHLDPKTAVQAWQRLARANVARRPEEREGFVLPYLSRPARLFGRKIPAVPEEMV
jgi:phospholipase D1/2